MTLNIKVGGAWRTVTTPSVRVSGAWRPVLSVWVRSNGEWRRALTAYIAPIVTVDNDEITGNGVPNGSPQSVFSNSATASVANGQAPFTYQWELIEGSATITSPGSASTAVRYNFPRLGGRVVGIIRCKVTDATGTVSYSPDVNYILEVSEGGAS